MKNAILTLALTAVAASASAQIVAITEWMYKGSEFIEFTNISTSPVDMTGWSFDDDSRNAGTVSLTDFGIILPGESVILAEEPDNVFRSVWMLPESVKIIGDNSTNLGGGDEINLFDSGNNLIDRLTYGGEASIITDVASGWTTPDNLGMNNVASWFLSSVGDAQGSYDIGGLVANPGTYAIPEPSTYAMIFGGLAMGVVWVRRRARS